MKSNRPPWTNQQRIQFDMWTDLSLYYVGQFIASTDRFSQDFWRAMHAGIVESVKTLPWANNSAAFPSLDTTVNDQAFTNPFRRLAA